MTLEELSKIDFKIWTGDGYKSLSREELNRKIQLRLFEHEVFYWGYYGRKVSYVDSIAFFYNGSNLGFINPNGGSILSNREYFEEHENTEISIEDILDYDDGGL